MIAFPHVEGRPQLLGCSGGLGTQGEDAVSVGDLSNMVRDCLNWHHLNGRRKFEETSAEFPPMLAGP